MLPLRYIKAVIVLLLFAVVAVVPATAGAQTKGAVDNAEAAQEQAYQDLLDANQAVGVAISELESIEAELAELNYTIARLERKIAEFDAQVKDLKASAREVVVEAYTNSGAGLVTAAFTAGSIQDLLTSQTLIGNAADRDLASLDLLTAVSRETDRLKAELAEKQAEVQALEEQQTVLVERLANEQAKADKIYAEAQDKYKDAYAKYQAELRRRAEEEARRQREAAQRAQEAAKRAQDAATTQKAANNTAAAAKSTAEATKSTAEATKSSAAAGLPVSNTPGVVCPVAGNTWFVDTWGAARPGGRAHHGVDMSGARGTPLVAMNSGKVRLNWHYAGGRQVYVYADDGNFYYYAHLNGYPSGLSSGQRVDKGQVIGYMGDSGNASIVHLHLGMGRIGGAYVNPYPTVRRVC